MMTWIFIATLVAFVVTVVLTRRICDPAFFLHLLDQPNERSLHSRPTPRTGGVAILVGFVAATPFWLFSITPAPAGPVPWLVLAAVLIAALSFMDDQGGLPVGIRLIGHLFAATLTVIGADLLLLSLFPGFSVQPGWVSLCLATFFLVWMVNLYNFMDGMDGFAGGMAVIGLTTFAILGWFAGNLSFVAFSITLSAAVAGFLVFNFPPARIFMGDTGSATLGLLIGGLGLWGARDGIFPFWVAILVFSPFIVDATVTLVRRLLQGKRVWQAHRTHYYQRLVQSGWGHRKTVLFGYGLMLACGLSALLARQLNPWAQLNMVILWTLVYVALMFSVDRMEKKS